MRQREEAKMTDFPSGDSRGDGKKWLDSGSDGRMRLLSKVGL